MPEGDSIFRMARTLHRALAGRIVVHFETMLPHLARVDDDTPIAGRGVIAARSLGKHLLIEFTAPAPGAWGKGSATWNTAALILRTHLRMHGAWHVYRTGERWRRPRWDMRIVIATEALVAVGFNIPVAEFIDAAKLRTHPDLAALGPDLLAASFDAAEATGRLAREGARPIGEALLDQRVLAGIGNIFRAEILFVCGISPFVPVAALTPEQVGTIVDTARRLLQANVREASRGGILTHGGLRATTGRGNRTDRLWVYARAGRPCRRCGTPVRARTMGVDARIVYWCPQCQV